MTDRNDDVNKAARRALTDDAAWGFIDPHGARAEQIRQQARPGDFYPISCPHCDHVADSMDSYGDSRAELDSHMECKHPDLPDPRHDPRWSTATHEGGTDD